MKATLFHIHLLIKMSQKFNNVHSAFTFFNEKFLFYNSKGFFNDDRPILKECTEDEDCMGNKQYCNKAIGYCECQQFYQYRVNTSNCNPCPGEGESCMSCCSSSTLICYNQVCTRCDTGYFECE